MKICPTCNHTAEDTINFCPSCGTMLNVVPEAPAAPAQEAPVYEAPAYSAPQQPYTQPQQGYVQPPQYTYAQPPYVQPTYVQPPSSPVSKGRVIPGMALGIAGMAMAIIGLLYTSIAFLVAAATEPEVAFLAAVYGFIFMAFSLPLSIVGFKMSTTNRLMGDQTTMSRLGVTFGRVGIILSIVMGAIAFISIFIAAAAF